MGDSSKAAAAAAPQRGPMGATRHSVALICVLIATIFMSSEASAAGIDAPALTADAFRVVTGRLPRAGELRDPVMQEAITAVGEVGASAGSSPNEAYDVVMNIPATPNTNALRMPPTVPAATEFTETDPHLVSVGIPHAVPEVPPATTHAAVSHDPFDDLFESIAQKTAQDMSTEEYQADKSVWLAGAPAPGAKVLVTTLAASAPPTVTNATAVTPPLPEAPPATEHKKGKSLGQDDAAAGKLKAALQKDIVAPYKIAAPSVGIPHVGSYSSTAGQAASPHMEASPVYSSSAGSMTAWDSDEAKINRLKENLRQEDERKKEEVAAAQKEVDAAKEALHEKIEADRTVETSMQNDLEKQQHDFHDYQTKLDFEQKMLHTDTATEITKLREDAKQKKEEHDRKVVEEKEKALQEVIHADAQQAEAAKEAFNQALAKKEEDAKKLAQVKEEKGHIQYVDDFPVEHGDDALRHQDASNAVDETLPPAAEAPAVPPTFPHPHGYMGRRPSMLCSKARS